MAAIAAGLFLRRRYLVVVVSGASMEPTIIAGERVLVRRVRIGAVRPGQIVVFEGTPDETWKLDGDMPPADGGAHKQPAIHPGPDNTSQHTIKRAVAVPGDPVPRDVCPVLRGVQEPAVPTNCLVVLGDARDQSYDSRHYGYVPAELLVGVVVRKLAVPRLPLESQRTDNRPGRHR
ncbi:S26 family signal peptidase [Flindersiella endophytica]